MRGCRRIRSWIPLAVEGELPLDRRYRLDEHVAGCAECRSEYEAAVALEEAMQRLPEPPVERLDLDRIAGAIDAAIDERLRAGAPEKAARRPRRIGLRAVVAAAAVAVLAAGALLWQALVDDVPDEVATSSVAAASGDATPGDATIDEARRDEVRATIAAELLAGLGDLPAGVSRSEVEERLAVFDERVRPLARGGWPVAHIAEGLLASEDVATARAAARFLGVRGDRVSAVALRRALDRPELARAAVNALGDLGPTGVSALAQALDQPGLETLALDALVRVGGPAAVRVLEAEVGRTGARVRHTPDPASERRLPMLVAALAACGPGAVESLLRLTSNGNLARDEAFGAIERVDGGADAVGSLVGRSRRDLSESLLLDAVATFHPRSALPWLEERCHDHREREAALACIAAYPDPEALHVLLRVRRRGSSAPVLRAARDLLADAPGAGVDLALRLLEARDEEQASRLLDFLLECEAPGSGPALSRLALSELLSPDERQWAALAVAEIGAPEDAGRLAQGLAAIGSLGGASRKAGGERIAAACLISIHALAGDPATLAALGALGGVSAERSARILAHLDEAEAKGTRAVIVYKLARELEFFYDPTIKKEVSSAP
ncbi:MAG: zf-HC2 domain-containing protein [Planctomycetota bacterium]|nr:zf-HC2 domain-containing protein [Planctomycetota bacterium]